ncbi:MAG: S-adenosylmethionine:tRNA ribosyltransferase-isomerase, partial [Spirochaetota bacterium]
MSDNDVKMKYSLKDLQITIPQELIAQYPRKNRENSRLLVFNINTQKIIDDYFYNLPRYISKQDCIIYNDARVIKARLYGKKQETGARLEILLLRKINDTEWNCLIRPARRVKKQMSISIKEGPSIKVIDIVEGGIFRVKFSKNLDYTDLEEIG